MVDLDHDNGVILCDAAKNEEGELGKTERGLRDKIHVRKLESKIAASRTDNKKLDLSVTLKWNPETHSCDMLVDETPQILSTISQKIIGDFIFED